MLKQFIASLKPPPDAIIVDFVQGISLRRPVFTLFSHHPSVRFSCTGNASAQSVQA
jgi:hypothetical protein